MATFPALEIFVAATRRYVGGDLRGALTQLADAETQARLAKNSALLGSILVQKASWLRETGQPADAQHALKEAEQQLALLDGDARGMVLGGLRMEQGIVARNNGDLEQAEQFLLQADEEARGKAWAPALVSDILANLASVYLDRGSLEAAREALARATAIDRQTGNARALANDLNLLALVHSLRGDKETAQQLLTEALDEAQKGGCVKEAADALGNLSIELEEAGQLSAAQKGYETALSLYERIGQRMEMANTQSSLAIVVGKQGDLVEARRLHQHALALHQEMGNHIYALNDLVNLAQTEMSLGDADSAYRRASEAATVAEERGLPDLLWRAHWLRARARSAAVRDVSDPKQQAKILNDEVLRAYADAVEAIELLRSGIGRPEEREQLLWNKEDIYGEALLLAGILSHRSVALAYSERSRERALLDLMGAERLQRHVQGDVLLERRESLIQQLADLHGAAPDRAKPLLEELRRVRDELRTDQPRVAAVTDILPDPTSVFDALPPTTALVEFFVGPGQHLAIFVLTRKGVSALTINTLGQIDLKAEIDRFRQELINGVDGVPTGRLLFHILFGPVWDVLAPMERLIIVPHRELHYIPFGATWFTSSDAGQEKVYLSQRFALSNVPSAAFLPICLRLPRPEFRNGSGRVLGNPTGDLAGAEDEAKLVAKQLGVVPLLRDEATRAALLEAPEGLGVIHIASHGVYDEVDPLLSGVVLADGTVTAEQLMERNLSTGLLTLSGCVTGMAKRQPGDELIGLTRAAAAAGIPRVIASLWPVWDDSTRAFFEHFYQALAKGLATDEALRDAQRSLIETSEFAHPTHWAPFVLFGDWR